MKYLVFLCLLPSVFGGYLESLAASAAASPPSEDRFKGMVAFHCGLPALHRNAAGLWVRDLYQDCVNTDEEVRRYCRRVYPNTEILNVERSPSEMRVAGWCPFDKEKCPEAKVVTVRPVRCLDASFQSDALLVPTGCTFGHVVPGMSSQAALKAGTCKSQDEWNAVAAAECGKRFHGFKLRRHGGLVPCQKDKTHQVGYFKGVEFVCCPANQAAQQPPLVSVSAVTFDPNAVPASKPAAAKRPKAPAASTPAAAAAAAAGAAPRDRYVDYLNRAKDPEESEHDRYMDAKEALRRRNRQREDQLVKSYIEAERSLDDTFKVDKTGGESLEKNVVRKFRRVFSAMLDEEMTELRQLDHIHQRRVLEKLHARSQRARKMLEYASQERDPQLKRVSEAAFSYLKSVMKEKVHAINHYSHLLETDPTEASRQVSQLRSYLHQLHEEMKKELNRIAQQAPPLSEKLTERILQYMRTYSEVEAAARSLEETGKLTAQPSKGESHKDLELEHMESVIKAYKHTDRGPLRKEAKAAPPKPGQPQQPKKTKQEPQEKLIHVLPVPGEDNGDLLADRYVHEEKKPVGFHHAKPNFARNDMNDHDHGDGHHENDGHGHRRMRAAAANNAVTWAVIGCVACAALVAAVSALVVLRRRYAGYSQAPANGAAATAVEALPAKLAPPQTAADLAAMQTNGYENPTYKYFELRGKSEDVSEA